MLTIEFSFLKTIYPSATLLRSQIETRHRIIKAGASLNHTTRLAKSKRRRQEAGGRRQEAGGRRQEAEGRRQEAEGRRQEAGGRMIQGKLTRLLILIFDVEFYPILNSQFSILNSQFSILNSQFPIPNSQFSITH
ncbi:MAG: CsbD family protein [Symploca sp. SIO3E6]|nr:CsbD family protein [Caldora sp. SIO3E6]